MPPSVRGEPFGYAQDRLVEPHFEMSSIRVTKPPARERVRAMVKIQEGCDQVCAYCIVPKVRGRERSIHPDALVEQINFRVNQGCQEVVLTGTQLGTYGFDLSGINLVGLIRR